MRQIADLPPVDPWQPIETAPRDGRPVWVRGNNYGRETCAKHYGWAFWDGTGWVTPMPDGSALLYLTHWLPLGPQGLIL